MLFMSRKKKRLTKIGRRLLYLLLFFSLFLLAGSWYYIYSFRLSYKEGEESYREINIVQEKEDETGENKGGSGLGLTITKQIIDLHEGHITVESEKNKGTKFIIILPVY